jgi:hypothetical protein
MPKFRIVTVPSGKPWTDWRDTREEANNDAVAVELAERYETDPATLYWDALAAIEVLDDDGSIRTENPVPQLEVAAPLPDWELWGCAHAVIQQHRKRAALHVTERIGALASKGDVEGVATWKAIAERVQALSEDAPRLQ